MLEFVRDLETFKPGQINQLFLRDDGQYIVVSTVPNVGAGASPIEESLIGLVGIVAGTAMSGEETMAFIADDDGEVADWGGIACSTGSNSRSDVLEDLGFTE